MKLILTADVNELGKRGDVVDVAEGYARNFLIPQGKARRATDAAIKEFEGRRADLEKAQAERLNAAQTVGERLNGASVRIARPIGGDFRGAPMRGRRVGVVVGAGQLHGVLGLDDEIVRLVRRRVRR